MKPKLSVVMITYNEADNLRRSLPSVAFADEIIVVDQGSEDDTVLVARELGAKVVFHPWAGFGKQKNVAIDHATGEWILSLDADEVVPAHTKRLVEATIAATASDAFYLPRRTFFLGRWIMHGDWYPDWQLRLFKRGVTRFDEDAIHERIQPTPHTEYLADAVLDHYSYKDIADYIARMNRYTSLEAETRGHQKNNLMLLLFKPGYRFGQMYLWQQGFRDGWAGLMIALLSGVYVFVTHVKIFEHQHKGSHHD